MSLGKTTVMIENRNQFRFPVRYLALLKHDGNIILCDVLDLTEQGLQPPDRIPDHRLRHDPA